MKTEKIQTGRETACYYKFLNETDTNLQKVNECMIKTRRQYNATQMVQYSHKNTNTSYDASQSQGVRCPHVKVSTFTLTLNQKLLCATLGYWSNMVSVCLSHRLLKTRVSTKSHGNPSNRLVFTQNQPIVY